MSELPSIPSDFNPSKERAAMARAYGASQPVAARLAGVSDRTIRRWERDDEHFQDLVERYGARALFTLGVQLQSLLPAVAENLWELMHFSTDNVRLGAINTICKYVERNEERLQDKREAALIEEQAAAIELRQLES